MPHGRTGYAIRHRWGARPDGARRSEGVAGEHELAERVARLQAATAALSAALTPADVLAAIASRGAALQGACGCAVALLRPPGILEVADARGAAEQGAVGSRAWSIDCALPLARAARERRPIFGGEPDRAPLVSAALPLESGGELLAVVSVVFAAPMRFDGGERVILLAFARQCAQALHRARLYEAEREARLAAERAAGEARRAVELEERLLGMAGHDLRTPLAAIRMSTELLFRGGGLSRDQARILARVVSSAGRMARIIRDLLDFTRIRREGRLPLSPRASDLRHLARRAVAELSAVHPDRELRLEAPASAPVLGDPDRLAQVLTNLLGNAIQHGPPDAPVRVSVGMECGQAVLRVHNEGPPMPPQLQSEIFEPFRRGATAAEDGSVGLGLFIVREIVRAHGGAVEVRSAEGEGTTFTVRLARPAGAALVPSGASSADLERRPAEG